MASPFSLPPGPLSGQGCLLPDSPPVFVGFSGFRRLCPDGCARAAALARAVAAQGSVVLVGDAFGLDAAVRSAGVPFRLFSVDRAPRARGAFAARSVAMVRRCATGAPGSLLAVFPGSTCPSPLVPSSDSWACFAGFGSGSWATAAFAAGLGLPVVVFPFGFSRLPAWGHWRPLSAGAFAGGHLLAAR